MEGIHLRVLSSIFHPQSSTPCPSPHLLTRWLFLRLLGLVYFIAFASLWVQISGLIGSRGILPAADFLPAVRAQFGPESYYLLPTLFWFNASDTALHLLGGGGALLSLLLVAGIAPGPILLLLWAFYLSLTVAGQDFLTFQWDNLLLETGFLAIFFAPWQLWPKLSDESPPSPIWLWLLRWLLFKLMFSSGVVKLLSGDPTWRDLTALTYHYETQPLPAWTSWYAHQLLEWFQKSSVVGMFVIELAAPFLIFAPRRLRLLTCTVLTGLQLLIILTGNYAFFNWLSIMLCLLLLDDAFLRRLLPRRWNAKLTAPEETGRGSNESNGFFSFFYPLDPANPRPNLFAKSQQFLLLTLAVIIFLISSAQMIRMFMTLPQPIRQVLSWVAPFRTFNAYGLFAVMTTTRPEIIIEGSNDGETWQAYEFKWKPGDPMRRPAFAAPHQPRLDWQMWFAALDTYQNNPWLINFMVRLLEGSPEVLGLLEYNPFPNAPPRYVRAMLYLYHFTDFSTTQPNGAWWQREQRLQYAPVLSLP
ncbi:MAG: lipase maturation factor family protein [Anaerolineae bacterium]|nr:lipase maturation factor family protein [Anaerolineae bacterium]